jgi:hypothetical protein
MPKHVGGIWVRRSTDGGHIFSTSVFVAGKQGNHSPWFNAAVWPAPMVLNSGRVLVAYGASNDTSGCRIRLVGSNTHGATWDRATQCLDAFLPRDFSDWSVGPSSGLQLESGRLLFSIHRGPVDPTTDPRAHAVNASTPLGSAGVLFSDDAGLS